MDLHEVIKVSIRMKNVQVVRPQQVQLEREKDVNQHSLQATRPHSPERSN